MKNLLKKSLIIFWGIILITIIIFWNRIYNSYRIYSLIENVTYYLQNGNENYNFNLIAEIDKEKKSDTLNAKIYYKKDQNYFYADVNYNQNEYLIKSDFDSTKVLMNPSNVIVAAGGKDQGNFDIIKLLGDILKKYPQSKLILESSFTKKIGFAIWVLFNCSFDEAEKNKISYSLVGKVVDSTKINMWMSEENFNNLFLTIESSKSKTNIHFSLNEKNNKSTFRTNSETKIINIDRKELNTAIYRGALRTGGLLLSRIEAPKINAIEKSYGNGKLIFKDNNRILLAKGTHKEIGEIHGALLKDEIRDMVDATLYTMCWVYTIERKSWFINDFREAYKRLKPFIPQKYEDEMIGISETSGISLDEIHLTNVFPELFHCSGFAVFNTSTIGGKLFHGRVLDYMTEIGLQFNAVVFILKPNDFNAFVNVGYAGFIGSVTGMNEKQVSFGEMGGGGEGEWDGMPMAFLMRNGLENTNTLDEAVKLFQETPRTCEYYYVIADGKIPDAKGLSTTPSKFEIINPNSYHEKLIEPVENAVIMSAGNRYKDLVARIKENHGKIDTDKAIHLMDRPVAMKSNLHNVLFAPQTLELWVSNAGVNTPAANEPYAHYNFRELLNQLN
ncbi:MAG: hypothetical protein IPH62_16745 [Ignavibacteriae bacterium]|nr:hypothetical protein [Ignavibacteriota bacterium]